MEEAYDTDDYRSIPGTLAAAIAEQEAPRPDK
jgi:hypothetical protein